jgi:putative ABC transport system permease protein
LLFLVGVRTEFGSTLQITVLGQAILVETGSLQVGVTAVASLLAVALLGELLWQAVIDRRRDIGVLRAIGWARFQVAWLMMLQGMVLGIVCGGVGVAVSAAILVPVFGPGSFGILRPGAAAAAGGGALLGLVASALPAYRAATEQPAGVLRSV